MPSSKVERKLAAIVFTDIAEYTSLAAKDSTKAAELLKTQRKTLKPIVENHGGAWMKEMGDGLLLTFDSATSAVECSIAIQKATRNIEGLNLRIGIHEGEVIKQDGDVIGDDVNVASRIEPFSAIGGIAISQKIEQAISSNKEFETKYIGKPKLKGVAQEVKVYCITSHGLPETDVSKVSAKLASEPGLNIFTLTGGVLTIIGIMFWISISVFGVSFGDKMEVPSVGILMMENLGKEDEAFWSSGMTSDLITKISSAGLIRVAPFEDIINLDKGLSVQQKAEKLKVKYILTHRFLIKDDKFDLWCKLENTKTGVALFSNKISEPIDMTTQIVGKLANDIVTSLNVKTTQNLMQAPTENAEAYELYLRAKKYLKEGHWASKHEREIAISLLNKAIALDDNLISAKHLLGRAYSLDRSDSTEYIAIEKYNIALKKSKELHNKLLEARILHDIGTSYIELGVNFGNGKNDYQQGLDYYKQALLVAEEIGDKNTIADILRAFGHTYHMNKIDYQKALYYFNQALELHKELDNQGNIWDIIFDIININTIIGNYDKALELLSKFPAEATIEDTSQMFDFWVSFYLGQIYFEREEFTQALKYFEKSLNTNSVFNHWAYPHVMLIRKKLNQEYSLEEINLLYKNKNRLKIDPFVSYALFKLTGDTSYLKGAYDIMQEDISRAGSNHLKLKFMNYTFPKKIIEEWEKVKSE